MCCAPGSSRGCAKSYGTNSLKTAKRSSYSSNRISGRWDIWTEALGDENSQSENRALCLSTDKEILELDEHARSGHHGNTSFIGGVSEKFSCECYSRFIIVLRSMSLGIYPVLI